MDSDLLMGHVDKVDPKANSENIFCVNFDNILDSVDGKELLAHSTSSTTDSFSLNPTGTLKRVDTVDLLDDQDFLSSGDLPEFEPSFFVDSGDKSQLVSLKTLESSENSPNRKLRKLSFSNTPNPISVKECNEVVLNEAKSRTPDVVELLEPLTNKKIKPLLPMIDLSVSIATNKTETIIPLSSSGEIKEVVDLSEISDSDSLIFSDCVSCTSSLIINSLNQNSKEKEKNSDVMLLDDINSLNLPSSEVENDLSNYESIFGSSGPSSDSSDSSYVE
jgi:hypothetical protein